MAHNVFQLGVLPGGWMDDSLSLLTFACKNFTVGAKEGEERTVRTPCSRDIECCFAVQFGQLIHNCCIFMSVAWFWPCVH